MTPETSTDIHFTMCIDKDICEAFSALCNATNISMSAAINSFMKQAVREQNLHLDLLDENGFTPDEVNELLMRIKDIESGRVESHTLLEE